MILSSHNVEQANDYLWVVLSLIDRYKLAPTPRTYVVCYEYVANTQKPLKDYIDALLKESGCITQPDIDHAFQLYIRKSAKQVLNKICSEAQELVATILTESQELTGRNPQIAQSLQRCSDYLENVNSADEFIRVIKEIIQHARALQLPFANIGENNVDDNLVNRLRRELDRIRLEATTDPLTQLPNRRAFERAYAQAVCNYSSAKDLCLLLIDIDHFKQVNDYHGHLVGDLILKKVAEVFRSQIKGQDIAARFGGEEFVILLPSTQYVGAVALAEKLRNAISEYPFKKNATHEAIDKITISVGVASYRSTDSLETFLERADKALYHAKSTGRNRVVEAI